MNKIIELVIERFYHLGDIPLCNGISSRAPHFFGYCFPLCYRCTFFLLLFLITLIVCYRKQKKLSFILCFLCLIPMIIDGSLQTFLGINSTNLRRALTGAMFGFGLGSLIVRLYMIIDVRE